MRERVVQGTGGKHRQLRTVRDVRVLALVCVALAGCDRPLSDAQRWETAVWFVCLSERESARLALRQFADEPRSHYRADARLEIALLDVPDLLGDIPLDPSTFVAIREAVTEPRLLPRAVAALQDDGHFVEAKELITEPPAAMLANVGERTEELRQLQDELLSAWARAAANTGLPGSEYVTYSWIGLNCHLGEDSSTDDAPNERLRGDLVDGDD